MMFAISIIMAIAMVINVSVIGVMRSGMIIEMISPSASRYRRRLLNFGNDWCRSKVS